MDKLVVHISISVVRTLELNFGNWTFEVRIWTLDIGASIEPLLILFWASFQTLLTLWVVDLLSDFMILRSADSLTPLIDSIIRVSFSFSFWASFDSFDSSDYLSPWLTLWLSESLADSQLLWLFDTWILWLFDYLTPQSEFLFPSSAALWQCCDGVVTELLSCYCDWKSWDSEIQDNCDSLYYNVLLSSSSFTSSI